VYTPEFVVTHVYTPEFVVTHVYTPEFVYNTHVYAVEVKCLMTPTMNIHQ